MTAFTWKLFTCFLLSYVRPSIAGFCTKQYPCESTCYRYNTYKGMCGTSECYKSRLEPYVCQDTCYKKDCCQGYTGDDCITPICFGETTCPNGGKCVEPNSCVCLPGYFGPKCILCDGLPSIQNGQFFLHSTDPNAIPKATLECSNGYTQYPDPNLKYEIFCDGNGHWSPFNHTYNISCLASDCGNSNKSISHGHFVVLQGAGIGSQAVLQCDDGYKSSSVSTIQCQPTGLWSEPLNASCTQVLAPGVTCGVERCTDPYSYCNPLLKICECAEGFQMNGTVCLRSCPSGSWGMFGDSCYYFGKIEFSYRAAKIYCDRFDSIVYDSSLVQIDTVEELNFVKNYILTRAIQPSFGYWNDAFQNTTNGVDEYWRSSGDPVVVSDWATGEPNRQSESCTVFFKRYNYKWADEGCVNSVKPDEQDNRVTAFALCEKKIAKSVVV